MQRALRSLLTVLALIGLADRAVAFSLQGPLATWMTPRLGYNINAAQYGGPMNIGEEYRWNVTTVYYGFTSDFVMYFGQRGIDEIDKAFAMVNALPPASQINPDDYPMSSQRINHRANALGILDLKSIALGFVLEQMGLCDPTRYVYTLRNRWVPPSTIPNYHIIRRNFDPIDYRVTSYINGVLWTYTQVTDVSDSESFVFTAPVDPLGYGGYLSMPVAGWWVNLLPGGYWANLTRDDVGGLKYLYRPDNYNMETSPPNAFGSLGGSGAWGDPGFSTNAFDTNAVGGSLTNNVISTAIRPGREKVTFLRADYDSLFGFFEVFTNRYQDMVITNWQQRVQYLERPVVVPDILFDVADLQGGDGADAIITHTAGFTEWVNNDAINGLAGNLGPGNINPGDAAPAFTVTLNGVNELRWNIIGEDELAGIQILWWGSFDGTTNEPVVYPLGVTLTNLEQRVFKYTSGGPWGQP